MVWKGVLGEWWNLMVVSQREMCASVITPSCNFGGPRHMIQDELAGFFVREANSKGNEPWPAQLALN